jgi:hypothetical protein
LQSVYLFFWGRKKKNLLFASVLKSARFHSAAVACNHVIGFDIPNARTLQSKMLEMARNTMGEK